MKNKKHRKNSKTPIGILILVALLIAGGIFCLLVLQNRPDSGEATNDNSSVQVEEDPKKGDTTNQDNDVTGDQDTSDALKPVSVSITYADVIEGQVSVGGIVTNVVETDGTCAYVFSGPYGKTATYTSNPIRSANSTSCAGVDINQNFFNPGNWSVVLKYQSAKSKGESASASFQIP